MSGESPVAGPQAEPAVVQEPPDTTAARVLDDAQRVLLRLVLNRIIPPRDDLPAAGDLGGGLRIEQTVAEAPWLRRLFLDGLTAIEVSAGTRFVDLDAEKQIAVLERVEEDQPAFFAALVDHAYRAYYTSTRVQHAIGWLRPPQPLGHTLPPFDPELLSLQRTREPFWRRTD